MTREEVEESARFPVDFESSKFWITSLDSDVLFMYSLESLESIDHLALTDIRSTPCVSSKLTTTRIRHDDE